jgi:hypothetical protein
MATKFGYVERNLENDVNWANVGKGFSDMLLAERDERKAKKGALNDAMQQTQEGLRKNAPLGYNTDFNDRMIGLAANSSAFVLAANKDLKAGRITPEEYMRKLHRVNSSADTTFALANNYNTIYEDKLKRMDDKDSGNVEQVSFEAMSKLVDFNKHDFMIDENGTIVAAPLITDENGITSLDTKNARSVQAIFNLAQNTVNRFDVLNTIQSKVKLMGTTEFGTDVAATYGKAGMKKLIKGLKLTDPKAYNEYKDAALNEMLVNDFDVASILTDFTSNYETTTDKKKWLANKDKYVYVDIENGKEIVIGELTEKQKEDAMNILDNAWEGQVSTSDVSDAEREMVYPQQSSSSKDAAGERKDQKRLAGIWNEIYYAVTIEDKNKLAQRIINDEYSKKKGLVSFTFSEDGKQADVRFLDSRQNTILNIGDNPSINEWAGFGTFVHGVSNPEEAMRLAGGAKEDGVYYPALGAGAALRGDAVGAAASDIKDATDTSLVIDKNSKVVLDAFKNKYSKYGFTFKNFNLGNDIEVTGPDDTTYKFNTNSSEDEAKGIMNDLNAWMTSKLTQENAERAYQTSSSGSSSSGGGEKIYVGVDADGNPIYKQQ